MNSHSPFLIGFVENRSNKTTNIPSFKLLTEKSQMLQIIERNKSAATALKIIVCGQSGAGKTSLIYRIRDNTFDARLARSNRVHLTANAEVANKKIWLRISDEEGTQDSFHRDDEDRKIKYDAYAAFILIKCTKKQKYDEIKLFITNKTQEIRKNYPAAEIVLVGSKSDKKFKVTSEILKQLAQELNCAGAAIISAKDGANINSLMACTLENLLPTQALIKTTVPVLRSGSSPCLFQPVSSTISGDQLTAAIDPFVTESERNYIIQQIDVRINELCMELSSVFATDKEKKIHKLLGVKELLDLIHFCSHIPIHKHIENIRNKYGSKLEEGDPSKTRIMLDDIYAIATRNVITKTTYYITQNGI